MPDGAVADRFCDFAAGVRAPVRDLGLRPDFLVDLRATLFAPPRANFFRFFTGRLVDFFARFAITKLPKQILQQIRERRERCTAVQRAHSFPVPEPPSIR
jgi:hypothetical protein